MGMSFADEYRCDFPDCFDNFDMRDYQTCAHVVKGSLKAYCAQHSDILVKHGVKLVTLKAAKEETNTSILRRRDIELAKEAKAKRALDYIKSLID